MKQELHDSYKTYQRVLLIILLCTIIVFILMSVCLMSSYWITTDGYRQGIFFLCIEEQPLKTRNELLPFDLNEEEELLPGCYPNRDVSYIRVCASLGLFTLMASLASACLLGFTIRFKGLKKIKSLRFAICTMLVAIICDMALVIIYPIQFAKEINKSNRDVWQLNSAYGMAFGVFMIAFGSLILLVVTLRRITTNYYETTPTSV